MSQRPSWHEWNAEHDGSLCGLRFHPEKKTPKMRGEKKGDPHRKVTCGECLRLLGRRTGSTKQP